MYLDMYADKMERFGLFKKIFNCKNCIQMNLIGKNGLKIQWENKTFHLKPFPEIYMIKT